MPLDIMSVQEWKSASGHWSQARGIGHTNLREIDTAVEQYHAIAKHKIEDRIRALNRILVLTRSYVDNKTSTSKMPHRAARRQKKIGAAEVLYKQADAKREYFAGVLGAERNLPAMFGVGAQTPMQAATTNGDRFRALARQVYGLQQYIGTSGQGRLLHESYWTEAIDPLHRNWKHPLNSPVFQEWVKRRHEERTTNLSFYRWFEMLSDRELMQLTDGKALLETAYQDAVGREEYRVFVDGNKLKKLADPERMEPFNTAPYHTNFFGEGWCIFVISQEGRLYCNNHDDSIGWFHAAFMGGKPVKAAGELYVKDGVLYAMTPKSGHYKPRPDDIINGLRALRHDGLDISATQVMAYKFSAPGKMTALKGLQHMVVEWYDAEQYVGSGGARGLLREEAISRKDRFVYVASAPKAQRYTRVEGDIWLNKDQYRGCMFPEEMKT